MSILTRGGLDCGGIKAECEGRVHTPALTEQCPVAGEPQVQRGALCIAQLGKVYPFVSPSCF